MPRLTSACFLRIYLTTPAQPPAWASWRHFHPLGCPMQWKAEKCQHKAKPVVVSHTFNVSQINAFHTQTKIATVFHVASFVNNPIWRWLPKSWFKARAYESWPNHTRGCACAYPLVGNGAWPSTGWPRKPGLGGWRSGGWVLTSKECKDFLEI